MFRYSMLVLFTVCVVTIAINAQSQDGPNHKAVKTNVQVLMHDKLTHAQAVLEGLIMEDFEKIANEAKMMRMIGRAASWQAIDTDEYKVYSDRYARTTSNLSKAALSKNLDAVLLQYLQLNISCVECHKYVREHRRARESAPDVLSR